MHQIEKSYGGLAGPATSRMIGKVAMPLLVCGEDVRTDGVIPHYFGAELNVVQGATNFLMGLDLQRFLRIELDVIDNVCAKQDKRGKWIPVELAQAAGSGLFCIRVDRFEDVD